MEIPNFINVLQHFSASSTEEAENVLTLKEAFPFSQVLHTLSARVCKDHGFSNSKDELQLAAVYAADRAVLKGIMETDYGQEETNNVKPNSWSDQDAGKADIAETIITDLARLHQLKQNFELLFVDGSATSFLTEPLPEIVPVSDESHKSRKERIVELAKAVAAPVHEKSTEAQGKGRRRKKDTMETIIDQIVTLKQEIVPENEKQKEQIEMIDHFIKAQPSISGTRERPIQPDDLSTIKTGEFGEAIISETLVEILLKQGKKEKAIEVLKKLIWKFPQKKAYFASQIEELKK